MVTNHWPGIVLHWLSAMRNIKQFRVCLDSVSLSVFRPDPSLTIFRLEISVLSPDITTPWWERKMLVFSCEICRGGWRYNYKIESYLALTRLQCLTTVIGLHRQAGGPAMSGDMNMMGSGEIDRHMAVSIPSPSLAGGNFMPMMRFKLSVFPFCYNFTAANVKYLTSQTWPDYNGSELRINICISVQIQNWQAGRHVWWINVNKY